MPKSGGNSVFLLLAVLVMLQSSLDSAQFTGGSSINLAFLELMEGVLYEFRIVGDPPLDDIEFVVTGGRNVLTVNETGFLLVVGTLDFETRSIYELSVEAVNVTTGTTLATATVTVLIINTNDHAPMFTQSSYTTYLPYEGEPSTYDISSMCSDSDAPPYNALSFIVQSFNPQNSSHLFVVEASGLIRRMQNITSTRTTEEYQITILCRDSPDPGDSPMADSADVTVIAQELNSGPPVFPATLVFNVTETKESNVQVGTFSVTDPDPQDPVTVEITSGATSRFQVQSLGSDQYALVSTQELDRESSPSFSVILTARDGPENFYRTQSSSATITVNLEDVNDNTPQFEVSNAIVTIARSYPLNVAVFNVRCTDQDVNDEITYSIASGATNVFYIETSNGSIFLAQDVAQSSLLGSYFLSIICTDGVNTPVSFINITVALNNTRAPQFSHPSHVSLNLSEDTAVNTVIFDVNATDDDGDTVSYRLVDFASNSQYFLVDSVSGQVTLKQALDFEGDFSQFGMSIEAVDDASQPLTSTVTIFVQVENVNEPPSFASTSYAVSVPESDDRVPLITPENFFQAQCQDTEDLPVIIKYSIIQIDPDPNQSGFDLVINEDTGNVSSTAPIDYETIGPVRYTVTLQCYDMDRPILNSSVSLDVTIENVNEYQPMTVGSNFIVADESLAIGSVIISFNSSIEGLRKVNVTDRDRNSVFRYSLSEQSPLFSIDNERSVLVSASELDTDDATLFPPSVCQIGSTPYCRITVPVTICDGDVDNTDCLAEQYILIVRAVNDNRPMFDQNRYETDVNEGLTGAAEVLAIRCIDNDQYTGGELTVTIVDQPIAEELFTVSPTAVTLRSGRILDYEERVSYSFLVQCTDGTDIATADVVINVLAVNERMPTFTNSPFVFNISKTSVPSVIATLSVTDGDVGVGGNLTYTLEPATSTFDVVKTSDLMQNALFFLRQDLSASLISQYEYNVTVTDGFSTTVEPITIFITDGNFNRPQWEAEFGPISLSTLEHNPVGSLVHTLRCTDGDAPNTVNSLITYSFHSPNRHFAINNETGIISIASVIIVPEGAAGLDFTLGVQCSDNGDPQLIQSGDVFIYVAAVLNNATILTPGNANDIVVSIPENLQVNGIVSDIVTENFEATQFMCTINDNNALDIFYISNQYPNCTIHLKTPLDADVVSTYFFPVTVSDTRYVTVNVTIFIRDVNDNAPDCSQIHGREFVHLIVEGEYDSLSLAALNCSDADEGPNGNLSYTIVSQETFGGAAFVWNVNEGILQLNGVVLPGVIDLSVQVSDQGTPPFSLNVQVIVNIQANDSESLRFSPAVFRTTVRENETIGAVIFNGIDLIAALMFGAQTEPSFALQSSDNEVVQLFSIEASTGDMILNRELNFENRTGYGIVIKASDALYQAFATLVVEVVDVNNRPVFSQPDGYQASINENTIVMVIQVRAYDVDTGEGGRVSYSLVETPESQFFTIDDSAGWIATVSGIDYELFNRLILQVVASDNGSPKLTSQAFVTVSVNNLNDNPPTFNQSEYVIYITDSDPIGSRLTRFRASDADNLGALDFRVSADPCPDPSLPRLDEVTQLFDVDDSTQELKLIGSVPTGVSTNYYFTVYVTDGEMLGQTCVNVFVREVTLLQAVFLETDVIGAFRYNLTQNLKEKAVDVTSRTMYTIISGNDDRVFGVTNSDTIVNEMKLDREEISDHRLLIDVFDQETGVNVTALLRIVVQDINDNAPMFTEPSYSFSVAEGTRDDPGVVLLGTFVAEDPDFLLNGEVRYTIDGDDTIFSLNNINGELSLLAILDREMTPDYNFNVIAEDLGVSSQSTSAAVMVTVSDINDNPPVFMNPVTQASILPGAGPGSLLVTLTVTDADEGSNADVSFSLTYDPVQNEELFTVVREIQSSGRYVARLQAVKTILEEFNDINIILMAMDGGEPALSATIIFALRVQNTPPEFPSAVYTSQVLSGEVEDRTVLVVTATDHDGQRVRYTKQLSEVGSEVPFAVNPENGAITTNGPITLNWPHRYLFEVIAEDNNMPAMGRDIAFVAVNIYNTSHLLILQSCNSTTVVQSNQELLRTALEDWYNRNGFSGSLFVYSITERGEADESMVQSRVLVYFVIGEFYQNWTSPLVPTKDTAQQYTKSFAFGEQLQSTIAPRLMEGTLFSNICILGSDIIRETPVTPAPPTAEITGTLIAVIVVVVFFVLAVCVMVFCICCYCYFAQKRRKAKQDKTNEAIYDEIATSSYTLPGAVSLHKNPSYQDTTQIQMVSLANLSGSHLADAVIDAAAGVAASYEEPIEGVNEGIRNVDVLSSAAAAGGDETAYEDMGDASESTRTARESHGYHGNIGAAVALHKNPSYQDSTQIQLVSLANLSGGHSAGAVIDATAGVAETTHEPTEVVNESIRDVDAFSSATATGGDIDETAYYEDMGDTSESNLGSHSYI